MKRQRLIFIAFLVLAAIAAYLFLIKQPSFAPTTQNPQSRKSVEDYFIEYMRVSPQEAKKIASDGVVLRVSRDTTAVGIVGNLYYYGFIDDETSFNKLLETAKDSVPGKEGAIKVGQNTIDVQANYYLNYNLSDEEIADELLNKGQFDPNFTQYTYLFMPSGPDNLANPTPY